MSSVGPSIVQERALRRRVVRLARIKMLERRQAMLFDFLAKAHTETPLFVDRSSTAVGGGIIVGPTTVTIDLFGSPMIRASVRNIGTTRASPLLTVSLRTGDGVVMRASTLVERLEPGATRQIELLCPMRGRPSALTWSVMP